MKKKKAVKSKAAKMRSLPARTLSAKTAKGVKGGFFPAMSRVVKSAKKGSEGPTETCSLHYGAIEWTY